MSFLIYPGYGNGNGNGNDNGNGVSVSHFLVVVQGSLFFILSQYCGFQNYNFFILFFLRG